MDEVLRSVGWLAIFLVSWVTGTGVLKLLMAAVAWRMEQRGAKRDRQEAQPQAGRRFCLYLRSFKADRVERRRAFWQLFFPWQFSARSSEEVLCSVLASKARVVAIGQPGEKLPELGAVRLYVKGRDEWRNVVRRLMRAAELVVLRADPTDGVLWEFDLALRLVPLTRLVLILPDKQDHTRFRELLMLRKGVVLPPAPSQNGYMPGISAFVVFDAQGKPFLRGQWSPDVRHAIDDMLSRPSYNASPDADDISGAFARWALAPVLSSQGAELLVGPDGPITSQRLQVAPRLRPGLVIALGVIVLVPVVLLYLSFLVCRFTPGFTC